MKMFQIKQQPYRDFHLDDGITKGGDPTCRYEYNNRNNGRAQSDTKKNLGYHGIQDQKPTHVVYKNLTKAQKHETLV